MSAVKQNENAKPKNKPFKLSDETGLLNIR